MIDVCADYRIFFVKTDFAGLATSRKFLSLRSVHLTTSQGKRGQSSNSNSFFTVGLQSKTLACDGRDKQTCSAAPQRCPAAFPCASWTKSFLEHPGILYFPISRTNHTGCSLRLSCLSLPPLNGISHPLTMLPTLLRC